jgi:hypothetical protein
MGGEQSGKFSIGEVAPLAGDEQEFGQADTGSWLVMIVERRP